MVALTISRQEVWDLLSVIADPEIPVVSIAEIGMLRDVRITEEGCEVVITPTYTACPAMGIIEQDIKATLAAHGVSPVTVRTIYQPPWTTDFISNEAKEKLRRYGIAPPVHSSCGSAPAAQTIACPRCGSERTSLISQFGSTACKALYKCSQCQEPFEYFKCH